MYRISLSLYFSLVSSIGILLIAGKFVLLGRYFLIILEVIVLSISRTDICSVKFFNSLILPGNLYLESSILALSVNLIGSILFLSEKSDANFLNNNDISSSLSLNGGTVIGTVFSL